MKKLSKNAVALSLCASFVISFFQVSAQKSGEFLNTTEETGMQANVLKDNPFRELMNQIEPLVEPDFEAHPELRENFDAKILEFQGLIANLTDNDKCAVANLFRSNVVETIFKGLRGSSLGFSVCFINNVVYHILQGADNFQDAFNLLCFIIDSDRIFNSSTTIKNYFMYRCLNMLL